MRLSCLLAGRKREGVIIDCVAKLLTVGHIVCAVKAFRVRVRLIKRLLCLYIGLVSSLENICPRFARCPVFNRTVRYFGPCPVYRRKIRPMFSGDTAHDVVSCNFTLHLVH